MWLFGRNNMGNNVKIRYPINKPGYTTRATQSILQYGVGAMVDFPDQTLMTAKPEVWERSVTFIQDPRLARALHVQRFGMPGTVANNANTREGISYVRFPEWYFCPVCRRFMPFKKWESEFNRLTSTTDNEKMNKRPKCLKCKCDIVPANIITVCKNGHIDDFPWVEWAHIKSMPSKPVCSKPELKFRTSAALNEGMQGYIVECETCKASATLRDAFIPDVFDTLIHQDGRTEFCCQGKHPWNGTRKQCPEVPVAKRRGDSSVYFSCSVSSIVIPSNAESEVNQIKECNEYKKILTILEDCDDEDEKLEKIEKRLSKWSEAISKELSLDEKVVTRTLKKLLLEDNDNNEAAYPVDSPEYRYEEYEALAGINGTEIKGSQDFLREETNIEEYDIYGLKKVVLVKKLREVRALVGFSRLQPMKADDMEEPGFVNIKENDTNWYPGYEVRGEGIFLQFDEEILKEWAETDEIIKRRENMADNYDKASLARRFGKKPDSEFTLLHTIAHLLLKQLSFECGYNIASLRERIYYNDANADNSMAGILVYTASGDSEGTLGGLVRQGRSDCFPRIFKEAVEKARMCSNDPVCITSSGQGLDSLNLAACHSCCLIPETSCESFNVFLDRALVIGTFELPEIGFYSKRDANGNIAKKTNTNKKNDTSENESGTSAMVEVLDKGSLKTGPYTDIWNYIKEDSDDEDEQKMFDELIEASTGMYEKPIYAGKVLYDGEEIPVDLIWKDSKTVLFLAENFDGYKKMQNSGWNCFCNAAGKMDISKLLKSIEVK